MNTLRVSEKRAWANQAVTGSAWMAGVMSASQVIRMASDLVLVRMVSPRDFGLVALMGAFIALTDAFTQGGLEVSITRSRRGDDEDFLNTAWTIQVIRGFALWALMLAATWPISLVYAAPQLRYLLPVMSLALVLNGFTSTALPYLSRHVSLRVPMTLFLGQQIVTVAVTLLLAFYERTVWALVIGHVAGTAFLAASSHLAVPGMRVRFRWDSAAWNELFHFGKWIFAGNMVSSVGTRLDDLILGKLAPMAALGIYDVSTKYPFLIRRAGAISARYLLLPILSRHHNEEPGRFLERVREVRATFALLGMAPILFLFFYGPLYFHTFFPKEYWGAGWICQLLSITVWLTHIKFSAEKVLLVLGDSKATAAANVWSLLGSVAGLLGGFALAGMTGFALGLALGPLLSYAYVQSRLARHGFPIVGQDLMYTGVAVGLICLGSVLPNLGLSHLAPQVRSVATFVSATVVMMAFLGVLGRHLVNLLHFRGVD